MATPNRSLRAREETLAAERERLRVRAVELRRQRMLLENELASPGISPAEGGYLQQRIRTLSTDEDAISQKMAKIDPELAQLQQQFEQQLAVEQQRQAFSVARARRQLAGPQIQQLEYATRNYERVRREREEVYTTLQSQAKKTMLLVAIGALAVAGLADLLSIIDIGWVISWTIPMVTWMIVRRVGTIDRSVQAIAIAQQQALTQLRLLRQRLRPQLAASGRLHVFIAAESLQITHAARSYVSTFIRDTFLTQITELVPVLNWLPLYVGQVVKLMIDERTSYRRARAILVPYRQTLDLLTQLELFEIETLTDNRVVPVLAQNAA